jgi:hypothetical protein
MPPIIQVQNLSKKYRIGANSERYLSLRDELAKKAKGLARRLSFSRFRPLPTDILMAAFWV